MKKLKKIIFVLISLGCLNFIIQAFLRYFQKTFSFHDLLLVVVFFGFCLTISILEVLDKFKFNLVSKKDNLKLFLIAIFFCAVSIFLILSQVELWIKILGFLCIVFFGAVSLKYFAKSKI